MADAGGASVFAQALSRLPAVRDGADGPSTSGAAGAAAAAGATGPLLTREWLVLCRTVIPVVEQLGSGFMIVRADISGNIEVRLCLPPPLVFSSSSFPPALERRSETSAEASRFTGAGGGGPP